jgi:hypothetical protein
MITCITAKHSRIPTLTESVTFDLGVEKIIKQNKENAPSESLGDGDQNNHQN